MTPHQILIVGIRLLVIFWFFSILGQAGALLSTLQNTTVSSTAFIISLGAQIVVAILLWLFPATFATKLLRAGNVAVQTGAVAFDEWRDLVFVAVGIFVLTRAIPDLIYWTILAAAPESNYPDFTLDQKAGAFASLVELAIGLVLTLGASGIGSVIQKGRRVGVPVQRS